MSYYDFDNHFWCPTQVCGQTEELEEYNEPSFASRIVGTIFAAFKNEEKNNNNQSTIRSETVEGHLSGDRQQQV